MRGMTLAEYLRERAMTREQFAEKVGAHPVTVSKWISGTMFPRREKLARIAALTGGAVTASDFMAGAA